MSTSTSASKIKEIASLIKDKSYEKALDLIKSALKADPSNIVLLIYGGNALFNTQVFDKSEQLYLRARGLDENNPNVLLGLIELYTSTLDYAKLSDACYSLGKIGGMTTVKGRKYIIKSFLACEEGKNIDKALGILINDIIPNLSKEGPFDEEKNPSSLQANIWLIRILDMKISLMKVSSLDDEEKEKYFLMYEKALSESIKSSGPSEGDVTTISFFSSTLIYLQQLNNISKLESFLYNLIFNDTSPTCIKNHVRGMDVLLISALCEGSELSKVKILEITARSLTIERNNALSTLWKGIVQSCSPDQNTKDESQINLKQGIKDCAESERGEGWVALASIYLNVNYEIEEKVFFSSLLNSKNMTNSKASVAIACLNKALTCINIKENNGFKVTSLKTRCYCLLSKAYIESGNISKAMETLNKLKEIYPGNVESYVLKIYMHLENEHDYEKALTLCEESMDFFPSSSILPSIKGWILFLQHKLQDALLILDQVCKNDTTSSLSFYRLGRVYWEKGEKALAFNSFLAAAKLDPSSSITFGYLGRYYKDIGDIDRSKKCFLKSLALDSCNEDSACLLGDMYISNFQYSLAFNIYLEATKKDPSALWAFVKLAYIKVNLNEHDEAISFFHSAIKICSNNPSTSAASKGQLWEDLSLTYFKGGKLTAALKACLKSIELVKGVLSSLCLLGNIYRALTLVNEALQAFRDALLINNKDIPSLKGLSDTLYDIAIKNISEQRYGAATEAILEGSATTYTLLKLCGNSYSSLKLQGDLHSLAKMVSACSFSEEKNVKDGLRDQLNFIKKGRVSYAKAIHLHPVLGSTYYDLAINNYYYYIVNSMNSVDDKSNVDRNDLQYYNEIAEKLLHSAITMEPLNSLYWNGLGVVNSNPLKRQHCFIRSVQIDNNHFAWNNLGMMYLEYNQLQVAKEALLTSQCLNPASGTMWLGHGLVKEKTAKTVSDFESVNAAYSCSMDARPPLAAKLAAGLSAYKLERYDEAAVALECYLQECQTNPFSYHILGVVYEASQRFIAASTSFETAISLLKSSKLEKELALSQLVYAGMGRVSIQLRKYDIAIESLLKSNLKHENNMIALCIARALKGVEIKEALSLLVGIINSYMVIRIDQDTFNATVVNKKESSTQRIEYCVGVLIKCLFIVKSNKVNDFAEKIVAIFPTSVYLCTIAARLFACNDQAELAFLYANKVKTIEQCPSINSFLLLRDIHSKFKNCDASLQFLKKAMHSYPTSPQLWSSCSSLLLQKHLSNPTPAEDVDLCINCSTCSLLLLENVKYAEKEFLLYAFSHLASGKTQKIKFKNPKIIKIIGDIDSVMLDGPLLEEKKEETGAVENEDDEEEIGEEELEKNNNDKKKEIIIKEELRLKKLKEEEDREGEELEVFLHYSLAKKAVHFNPSLNLSWKLLKLSTSAL